MEWRWCKVHVAMLSTHPGSTHVQHMRRMSSLHAPAASPHDDAAAGKGERGHEGKQQAS